MIDVYSIKMDLEIVLSHIFNIKKKFDEVAFFFELNCDKQNTLKKWYKELKKPLKNVLSEY